MSLPQFVRQRLLEGDVADGQSAAGLQHAGDLAEHGVLVRRQIDHAVADHAVHRGRRAAATRRSSPDETRRWSSPALAALRRASSSISGVMSMPMARPRRADLGGGQEHVQAAAAAQIDDHLAGPQAGLRRGVAAATRPCSPRRGWQPVPRPNSRRLPPPPSPRRGPSTTHW